MSDKPKEDDKPMTADAFLEAWLTECEASQQRWLVSLKAILPRVKNDPEELSEVQADLLSNRQLLVEETAYFSNKLSGVNAKLKKYRKDKYVYYSTGQLPDGSKPTGAQAVRDQAIIGLRLNKGEKDLIISGDLSKIEQVTDILATQLGFLRECIKNVDHGLYSVKNRIDIMNILLR